MNTIDKIVLGTVQFGFPYGINNQHGKLDFSEVVDILTLAQEKGLTSLDTADAYGDSIDFIGNFHKDFSKYKFQVYSKPSITESKDSISTHLIESLDKLGVNFFEGYMFHSYSDFIQNQDFYIQLKKNKNQSLIKKIGVSLYTNDELKSIIENHDVDFVQIPFNVLDNWSQKGELILQAKEKHIDIHVRSIFLQGLFFMDELRIPSFLNPLKPFIIIIKQIAKEEKVTIQELLITYVLSNPNIDKVLFGVDNLNQLKSNLDIFNKSIDSQRIRTKIDSVKVNNNFLLDIRNWK